MPCRSTQEYSRHRDRSRKKAQAGRHKGKEEPPPPGTPSQEGIAFPLKAVDRQKRQKACQAYSLHRHSSKSKKVGTAGRLCHLLTSLFHAA
jgi:hypothetical protein